MFEFSYSIDAGTNVLEDIAAKMGVPVVDGLLQLPSGLGNGQIRYEKLPNKLEAYIFNFTLSADLWFSSPGKDSEYYVFVCEEVTGGNRVITEVDGDTVERSGKQVDNMYLLSFLSDLRQFASSRSTVRGFRVVISPEWLAAHLRIDKMEDVLRRYLGLKAHIVLMKETDPDSAQWLKEILDPPDDLHTGIHAYLQNRISLILENFFSWLHQQMGPDSTKGISSEDIARIREVEKLLLTDLSHAPTIEELAKHAAMSVTRLKSMFREVFGMPPYVYFQQHRMIRAKELLLKTSSPVHEIGAQLGYKNMSNFILAFRKVFHITPGELRNKAFKVGS